MLKLTMQDLYHIKQLLKMMIFYPELLLQSGYFFHHGGVGRRPDFLSQSGKHDVLSLNNS